MDPKTGGRILDYSELARFAPGVGHLKRSEIRPHRILGQNIRFGVGSDDRNFELAIKPVHPDIF